MKKIVVCIVLAFMLVIGTSSVSLSGVYLDSTTACNDYFCAITSSDPGVFIIGGYEYGCGDTGSMVSGSINLAGGYAYVGITESTSSYYDYGVVGKRSYVFNMSGGLPWPGSYNYMYLYLSSGSLTGHGGTGSASLYLGSPPSGAPTVSEPNEANP